ncbi:hypothetical protein Tco_0245708 [Tanacetum coccineum]
MRREHGEAPQGLRRHCPNTTWCPDPSVRATCSRHRGCGKAAAVVVVPAVVTQMMARVLVMVMGCMALVVAGGGGVGANWCFDGGACGGVVDRMKMVERMV